MGADTITISTHDVFLSFPELKEKHNFEHLVNIFDLFEYNFF